MASTLTKRTDTGWRGAGKGADGRSAKNWRCASYWRVGISNNLTLGIERMERDFLKRKKDLIEESKESVDFFSEGNKWNRKKMGR